MTKDFQDDDTFHLREDAKQITLYGVRTDEESVAAFFEKSSVMKDNGKNSNLIVIHESDGVELSIRVLNGRIDWRDHDPDSIILARWPGQWSSDTISFKLADYFAWLANNATYAPPKPKGRKN